MAVAGLGSGCETALALLRAHPEVGSGVLIAPPKPLEMAALVARVVVLVPDMSSADRSAKPPDIQHGRVEVIAGADQTFRGGLPALGRAVVALLEER